MKRTPQEITSAIINGFAESDLPSEFDSLKGLLIADHSMDAEEMATYRKVIDTHMIAERMDTINAKSLLKYWNTAQMELDLTLPETCYTFVETEGKICIIKRGESGYYNPGKVGGGYDGDADLAKKMNRDKLNVNRFQQEAMEGGSMFGWDVPGADARYCFDMFIERLTESANRTY